MKHTIYVILEEEHNSEPSTTVHATEQAANEHLRRIMESAIAKVKGKALFGDADIDSATDEQCAIIEQHIALGEWDEAWNIFLQGGTVRGDTYYESLVRHEQDDYSCQHHEIELPDAPEVPLCATLAAQKLIGRMAAMTKDGEIVDGEPFDMTNDDAVDTLHSLISAAREIVMQNASDATQKALRWFIVHGRLWGDDDDSACRYQCATSEEAEAAFREEMGEENGACILTDENMHTKDDCTKHDHERIKDGPGCVFIINTFDCGEHMPEIV